MFGVFVKYLNILQYCWSIINSFDIKMPGHFTFYTKQINGRVAEFNFDEFGHAIRALRYNLSDEIHFTDGLGNMYTGRISRLEKKSFFAEINTTTYIEKRSSLMLCCGIIKSTERMEFLIEKCTEIGVSEIFFVKTVNSERSLVNIEKLSNRALAAMKQSHGCWLPLIKQITWKEVLEIDGYEKYIATVHHNAFSTAVLQSKPVCILIGPEGDFTEEEKNTAITHGFNPLKLGNSILRTETAAIVAAVLGNNV